VLEDFLKYYFGVFLFCFFGVIGIWAQVLTPARAFITPAPPTTTLTWDDRHTPLDPAYLVEVGT
jgi:hypothetical protein